MARFQIEKLLPIRRNGLWMAEITIRNPEELSGASVAQVATMTVRFSYDNGDSVQGLLEAAYAAAKRCLSLSSDHLETNSLSELLDQEQKALDDLDKPFEFSFDPPS